MSLPGTKYDNYPLRQSQNRDQHVTAEDWNEIADRVAGRTPMSEALVTATGSTTPRSLGDWSADAAAALGKWGADDGLRHVVAKPVFARDVAASSTGGVSVSIRDAVERLQAGMPTPGFQFVPALGVTSAPTGTGGEALTYSRTPGVAELIVSGVAISAAATYLRTGVEGALIEPSVAQLVTTPDAPTNETKALTTGNHQARIEGTGSLTITATTATATGLPLTITASTPGAFNVSGAGNVTFAYTGSVTFAQVEKADFPTSRIHTGGATRVLDSLSLASPPNVAGGGWYVRIRARPFGGAQWISSPALGYRGLASLGAGGAANSWQFYMETNSERLVFLVYDSAGALKQIACNPSIYQNGVRSLGSSSHEFVAYAKADGTLGILIDGVAPYDATVSGAGSGIVNATPATLRIGASGGLYLGGYVEEFAFGAAADPTRAGARAFDVETRPYSIACIGDSMTQGIGITGVAVPYPVALATLLGAPWTATNYGVGGDTLPKILQRWGPGIRRQGHGSVVVLAGYNDLTLADPAVTVFARLRRVYDEARAYGARVVAVTVLPASLGAGPAAERLLLNQMIRNYAASAGLVLVDAAPLFDNGSGLLQAQYDSGDGVHPSQAGLTYLASLIRGAFP